MNIVDILIILLLIIGAVKGWKYGCFSSAISLIGTILVFVLAYYLKNPVSVLMYENLPFYNFGGVFYGITSFNILLYEGVAYLVCLVILGALLGIVLKLTGIVDKLINMTMILALPSKVLGLLFGAIQYYIIIFFVVFILMQLPFSSELMSTSQVGEFMLNKTPALSNTLIKALFFNLKGPLLIFYFNSILYNINLVL